MRAEAVPRATTEAARLPLGASSSAGATQVRNLIRARRIVSGPERLQREIGVAAHALDLAAQQLCLEIVDDLRARGRELGGSLFDRPLGEQEADQPAEQERGIGTPPQPPIERDHLLRSAELA